MIGRMRTILMADYYVPQVAENVTTLDQLYELRDRMLTHKTFALDTETDSTHAPSCGLVGIALSLQPDEAYYIPLHHVNKDGQRWLDQLTQAEVKGALAPILTYDNMTVRFHNAKFDMHVLRRNHMPVKCQIEDSMIKAWLMCNGRVRSGLKPQAKHVFGVNMMDFKTLKKRAKHIGYVSPERAGLYACADAEMTFRLVDHYRATLPAHLLEMYTELELPFLYCLYDMEVHGIKLDVDYLAELGRKLTRDLAILEDKAHMKAGCDFSLTSTQQVADVLFNIMKLPTRGITKKGKNGHYSTAHDVLQELRGHHSIVPIIQEHRTLSKLNSTYIQGVLPRVQDGSVHTSFNSISTGRLSSEAPNLQNVPVRTDEGRAIREAYVARDGYWLFRSDYSQVELRVLAHVTKDPVLTRAFLEGKDIHRATAAEVLGIPIEFVSSAQRGAAKAVNFGVVYGQSAWGLHKSTGMTPEEAQDFLNRYFARYAGVARWLLETRDRVKYDGYVETFIGRRKYFQITPKNADWVGNAAVNMPIQGGAADIIKHAMIQLRPALALYEVHLLLQVHDELIFEVAKDELDYVAPIIKDVMEYALTLDVPLAVDMKVGPNWADMEEYEVEHAIYS